MSKLVVTEHRSEEGAARAEQKYVSNLVNIITSQKIKKLPDVNAAEALRHVQGISLWSDTGEGRFVAIRGLDADLNSTTFNGVRLLPTNPATVFGGGRAVALDVIPAGLIGSMAVTKTNKPEQDAEALGGTIDIVPKSIPVSREWFMESRLGTGYENLNSTLLADMSVTGGFASGLEMAGRIPVQATFPTNPSVSWARLPFTLTPAAATMGIGKLDLLAGVRVENTKGTYREMSQLTFNLPA